MVTIITITAVADALMTPTVGATFAMGLRALVGVAGLLGPIVLIHVVVVVVLLLGAVEVEVGAREAAQTVAQSHATHGPGTGCHHCLLAKALGLDGGSVAHAFYTVGVGGPWLQ